jgi:phosphoribosylformylglycinamidine (FGAM) synthase-like enzyme
VYHRPVGTWARPEQIKVPLDPPAQVLEELKKPRDYTADLKKLLASPNICSKRWVFEQYDSMVQTNTVQGPGGEAGVMRIKGSGTPGHERGLAMALRGERALVLSRSETGRDARCRRSGAQSGLHGCDAGGGDELSELWESGEAGDYGAAFRGD